MYSTYQLSKKYIHYLLTAQNGKGHGVHSPFVFDFIIHVLNDKKKYDCYDKIESLRKRLLANNTKIEVEDFGAGSSKLNFKSRRVKDIAASSLKSKKYAQLLFRTSKYYGAKTILELGTSLGITTSYLASANAHSNVFTFEGSKNVAGMALKNFETAGLGNIELIEGDFSKTLPAYKDKLPNIDLLFVDGNHRKEATLEYFNFFLSKATPPDQISRAGNNSIFIFDDIHWSRGMEEAWQAIRQHPSVTLTIDLFFIGLVFFSNDFKVKQHFTIRF